MVSLLCRLLGVVRCLWLGVPFYFSVDFLGLVSYCAGLSPHRGFVSVTTTRTRTMRGTAS